MRHFSVLECFCPLGGEQGSAVCPASFAARASTHSIPCNGAGEGGDAHNSVSWSMATNSPAPPLLLCPSSAHGWHCRSRAGVWVHCSVRALLRSGGLWQRGGSTGGCGTGDGSRTDARRAAKSLCGLRPAALLCWQLTGISALDKVKQQSL